MKKVLGLFLVMLVSSVTVFAQERGKDKPERKEMDPEKRWEKMAEDLKLDENQTAEFKKINDEFMQKMKTDRETDRETMEAKRKEMQEKMLTMQNERNEKMKSILSEEQYQQYLDKQQNHKNRKHGKEGMKRGDRKSKEG